MIARDSGQVRDNGFMRTLQQYYAFSASQIWELVKPAFSSSIESARVRAVLEEPNMKTTFFAILALCGTSMLSAQPNKTDPEALTATQYTLTIDFGQGTSCGGGTCPASGTIFIPAGQRFVIENISARFAASLGTGDNPEQALTLSLNVAGTGAVTVIPFERVVTSGSGVTYYVNKAVRMYMDLGFGFPTVQVANQGTGAIGPFFPNSKGQLIFTLQGHLVPTS